ncbi:NAD(P)-dependent alcohol dehydrogenase [Sphingobium sp. CR2-8]|uniref:zinc-dependent alcohol dehydrogenase family protein n=1 Tax=Sphingobium sp. CR2-8 TaxID=1306534 RepID=UPI002DB5E81B|nr:NAD(P)-dependent alcohol dehydrogenase [Sphingobium sp. CR2-8]MEC3909603.1 NAD(P)-dependent alcohol dehydrogenase [Sphingobium sp. CR2-8]
MRAYHLINTGSDLASGLNYLRIVDLEIPRPARGEALVRQHAASLNYVDLLAVSGQYPPSVLPQIPLMDSAGVVVELGEGTDGPPVGTRVAIHMLPDWLSGPTPQFGTPRARGFNMPGALSEYAVVPSAALARLPDTMSFAVGATFSTAGTTAWNVVREANVMPGSTVLILGTGNISLFALQFAKAQGARVIITSSSDEKLALARDMGADCGINYVATPNWDGVVLDLTDGKGVQLIVETTGAETFAKSIQVAAVEGIIASAGWRTGATVSFPINRVQQYNLRIVGGMVGSVADFKAMMRGVAATGIAPRVDRCFDFENASDAYRWLARGGGFGKVVITI